MAKVFGIDSTRPEEPIPSISHADPYAEDDPTVGEWALQYIPTRDEIVDYVVGLFPFMSWITKYNTTWLVGDLVAGESSPSSVATLRLSVKRARPFTD